MNVHDQDPRRVVITGVGAVTAAGHGAEALREALAEGRPRLRVIERFKPAADEPSTAGQVEDFRARDWMPLALSRQTDRSTHMAFAAARLALEDAGIDLSTCEPLRCGALIGIGLGGMVFAEPQLYNQRFLGPDEVSTYQSIAWFYAAAMGQLSIALDLRGYSKTFVADRVSSLHALGHAFHMVRDGRADLFLAGGTEAPLAPFIYRSLNGTGWLGKRRYLPFSDHAEGFLLGEGSVLFAIESLAHAEARGADIVAEITGFGMSTECHAGPYEAASAPAIRQSARRALNGTAPSSEGRARTATEPGADVDVGVDVIVADGTANPEADAREAEALQDVLAPTWDRLSVTAPKAIVGELYGAGGALQVAAAAESIRAQRVWPLVTEGEVKVPHVKTTREARVDAVLVHATGISGLSSSLLVHRFSDRLPANGGSAHG